MTARRRRVPGQLPGQDDLFSVDPAGYIPERLAERSWPPADRFPVNHGRARVRSTLWADLTSSESPLVVAGFSSIASLVDLVAAWDRQPHTQTARILLGTEPFASNRVSFASRSVVFTEEVRRYWVEQEGISLRLSAKVLQVLRLLDDHRLEVRYVHGRSRLHAKVYIGDQAATVGSSNFTDAGLGNQIEANARFARASDARRYREAVEVAENLWSAGESWDVEFRDLLQTMLRFVPWQEALARACADLLEGSWAERYLGADAGVAQLWPSQVQGIAQALWIVENVGSVLVADATGSGKTRMGAHLVRAVRDRLWSTGRVRRDLTVLVCPPAVEEPWLREAVSCGLSINTVSHGLLSRESQHGPRVEALAVRQAQILAVDECHNFLTPDAKRTRQVRSSLADHVLLLTATPINRGAADLLQLVGLLGADNFEDETLAVLDRLERRGSHDLALPADQQERLRREIQRFTVRRTKTMLNELVDGDPESYRHPDTGRICRYPRHEAEVYPTGESQADEATAMQIREHASELKGIAQLGRTIAVPVSLAHEYTAERWRDGRLASARGLAAHHVLSAMRSSRAALIEHVAGTAVAARIEVIPSGFKSQSTGDMLGALHRLAAEGPPRIELDCALPDWLTDDASWQAACTDDVEHYQAILDDARRLSDTRERRKAQLLTQLNREHRRVIAFDRHLITLYAIESRMDRTNSKTIIATGENQKRKDVERAFAPHAVEAAIALCSDAMNEGLNLQGASAIVHLDLPTTLRVAEQRVGRVDRMDSPHDAIAAWWPRDGSAFATRANELLAARTAESNALLGSNLTVPNLSGPNEEIIAVEQHIAAAERPDVEAWDGIHDALDPVRNLVTGPRALLAPSDYELHRTTQHRVLARISPIHTSTPWVFLAIAGTAKGAPRWLLLEGENAEPVIRIDDIANRLRYHLADDPPPRNYDDTCDAWLNRYLSAATKLEHLLIPRRLQRALRQMSAATEYWARTATRTADGETAERWTQISALATPRGEESQADAYLVAETWLALVQPVLESARREQRRSRYLRLAHIDARLRRESLDINAVEHAFSRLELAPPLAKRVSACILGVRGDATSQGR